MTGHRTRYEPQTATDKDLERLTVCASASQAIFTEVAGRQYTGHLRSQAVQRLQAAMLAPSPACACGAPGRCDCAEKGAQTAAAGNRRLPSIAQLARRQRPASKPVSRLSVNRGTVLTASGVATDRSLADVVLAAFAAEERRARTEPTPERKPVSEQRIAAGCEVLTLGMSAEGKTLEEICSEVTRFRAQFGTPPTAKKITAEVERYLSATLAECAPRPAVRRTRPVPGPSIG